MKSITDRWKKIFKEDRYRFRNLKGKGKPTVLIHPDIRDLVGSLEGAEQVTKDTELLFYFVGHSVSVGSDDIRLILGLNQEEQERRVSLIWLLDHIYEQTRFRKLVLILDTCHAGRVGESVRHLKDDAFAMFGAGNSYAFDAIFSDGVLRALEQPFRKNDQRIDRRAGGMTYNKIFEEARRRVISGPESNPQQEPTCFGDYGKTLLLPAPVSVPTAFNIFASNRTVYGRTFRLLEIIRDTNPTPTGLRDAVRRDPIFLLRRNSDGKDQHLSVERLNEYLDFLRKATWVVQPKGRFELTERGQEASKRETFNKIVREVMEEKIFSDGVTFEFLDQIVMELLSDMIPPTPVRIKDRSAMKGKLLGLDVAARVAIQLLPSTGRFVKGASDAIYPVALGG